MKQGKNTTVSQSAVKVIEAAYKAWSAGEELRRNRLRNKNFTYGRQLDDVIMTPEGEYLSEKEYIIKSGKEPLTNNLIRQLVKSVVGRYRSLAGEYEAKLPSMLVSIYNNNYVSELDARMLEEFLISGCCVQKVGYKRQMNNNIIGVDNVNINRFFINAIADTRATDCNIVGELHDYSIAEIIMLLANGDRERAKWIRMLYSADANSRICEIQQTVGSDNETGRDFWNARGGKCRIIETWTLESREVIKCHDCEKGELFLMPSDMLHKVDDENITRIKNGKNTISVAWNIVQVWHCRWLTPMGDIVAEYDSPYAHHSHPYVIKMYPLTDGEIHAFVEDVIDQQKYINRLITLVDHVMNSSAKGVLLYPSEALPQGFSWDDIKRLWRIPNGVIPYDTENNKIPSQVSSNGTNIGAYELLSLEMKLFDQISGVSGAMQGRDAGSNTGAALFESQIQNATIALTDIFETFKSFTKSRNTKLLYLISA